MCKQKSTIYQQWPVSYVTFDLALDIRNKTFKLNEYYELTIKYENNRKQY